MAQHTQPSKAKAKAKVRDWAHRKRATEYREIGNILLLICGNPDELYFNDEPFAFDEKVSFFCLHKSMIWLTTVENRSIVSFDMSHNWTYTFSVVLFLAHWQKYRDRAYLCGIKMERVTGLGWAELSWLNLKPPEQNDESDINVLRNKLASINFPCLFFSLFLFYST